MLGKFNSLCPSRGDRWRGALGAPERRRAKQGPWRPVSRPGSARLGFLLFSAARSRSVHMASRRQSEVAEDPASREFVEHPLIAVPPLTRTLLAHVGYLPLRRSRFRGVPCPFFENFQSVGRGFDSRSAHSVSHVFQVCGELVLYRSVGFGWGHVQYTHTPRRCESTRST